MVRWYLKCGNINTSKHIPMKCSLYSISSQISGSHWRAFKNKGRVLNPSWDLRCLLLDIFQIFWHNWYYAYKMTCSLCLPLKHIKYASYTVIWFEFPKPPNTWQGTRVMKWSNGRLHFDVFNLPPVVIFAIYFRESGNLPRTSNNTSKKI